MMNKLGLIFVFGIFIYGSACESEPISLQQAEQLAKTHCASCHQYPEPNLLDKKSWNKYILPRMGYMMGVLPEDSIGTGYIEANARKTAFKNPKLFRPSSTLKPQEWQAIRDFYVQLAPRTPILPEIDSIIFELPHFKVKRPTAQLSPPSTTMTKIIGQKIWIGDAHTHRLYQFDSQLSVQNVANVKEGLVNILEFPSSYLATIMGSFSPTDKANGLLLSLPKNPQQRVQIMLDSLQRPVHTSVADLNQDGQLDLIICEFGKWTGGLSWWENRGNQPFKKQLLRNMPGAIKAYPHDFNQDGKMDIIALFGQGDEGIFIFYNQGSGQFQEEQVLAFPPSYGSSFFRLVDFNGDGFQDIIYTAGDNADFPPITKAYHGVYVFLNDGKNQFQQEFFYPLLGAYAALPNDYDMDGDLDIAAIAFFPDFANEKPISFVYLQNQGNLEFKTFSFPEMEEGRWLVMDAGDLDGDSDLDLVLGSLAFEVIPDHGEVKKWTESGLPFLVLENTILKEQGF